MVIRFLNYTFVSFFSWKQISGFATPHSALQRIIRNIYYGQIMSYSLQAECGVANLVIRFLNYTFVFLHNFKF